MRPTYRPGRLAEHEGLLIATLLAWGWAAIYAAIAYFSYMEGCDGPRGCVPIWYAVVVYAVIGLGPGIVATIVLLIEIRRPTPPQAQIPFR